MRKMCELLARFQCKRSSSYCLPYVLRWCLTEPGEPTNRYPFISPSPFSALLWLGLQMSASMLYLDVIFEHMNSDLYP